MRYSYYKEVRQDVFSCHLYHQTRQLPIDLKAIFASLRIELIEQSSLFDSGILGKSTFDGKRWKTFYVPSLSKEETTYTLAHELGHILSGHAWEYASLPKQIYEKHIEQREREADCFAIRLLSPLCVLHGMQVASSIEIAQACCVPLRVAKIRFARLRRMQKRGCFFLDRQEGYLFQNFMPYIQHYCKTHGKDTEFPKRLMLEILQERKEGVLVEK